MYIQTTIRNYNLFGKLRRDFRNRIIKDALQYGMRYWHAHILPRHFDNPQALEVRYPGVFRRRTAKYQRRKAREKGHTNLLVWSGETKRSVLGPPRISGSSKRVRIVLVHPAKRRRNKSGRWTSMPIKNIDEELTAFSRRDDIEISRALEGWLKMHLLPWVENLKGETLRLSA